MPSLDKKSIVVICAFLGFLLSMFWASKSSTANMTATASMTAPIEAKKEPEPPPPELPPIELISKPERIIEYIQQPAPAHNISIKIEQAAPQSQPMQQAAAPTRSVGSVNVIGYECVMDTVCRDGYGRQYYCEIVVNMSSCNDQ